MRLGEKLGYIEALRQRTGSLNVERLLLTKENQITQIKEFSAFLHKGRCKNLGWGAYETIPLMCISAIWASILYFLHSELPWDEPRHLPCVVLDILGS